jgi:hypothetical protein
MVKSLRNNRNIRLRSRKNSRSKSRKHNTQRGGEVKYVKALYEFDPKKHNPAWENYANIRMNDIIVETSHKDAWAAGINITNGCARVVYPLEYRQIFTPAQEDLQNINICHNTLKHTQLTPTQLTPTQLTPTQLTPTQLTPTQLTPALEKRQRIVAVRDICNKKCSDANDYCVKMAQDLVGTLVEKDIKKFKEHIEENIKCPSDTIFK